MWGALTAELSRREAQNGKEPQYQTVGESLLKDYRFTYLYPAEQVEKDWRAWLPTYREGVGLTWAREDQKEGFVGDRQFRRRLLSTRLSTSIAAGTDSAEDGSLRETECIETRWRDAGPVAMVGYVFMRTAKANKGYPAERRRLDGVDTLFVGGDTRYGLGRLRRATFDYVKKGGAFGGAVTLDADAPQVTLCNTWAHAHGQASLCGALELLGGWDRGTLRSLDQTAHLWQPGSHASTETTWAIGADGVWRATS